MLKENIDGFSSSCGYECIIDVNRKRTYSSAADASYYSYSLIRNINKS